MPLEVAEPWEGLVAEVAGVGRVLRHSDSERQFGVRVREGRATGRRHGLVVGGVGGPPGRRGSHATVQSWNMDGCRMSIAQGIFVGVIVERTLLLETEKFK